MIQKYTTVGSYWENKKGLQVLRETTNFQRWKITVIKSLSTSTNVGHRINDSVVALPQWAPLSQGLKMCSLLYDMLDKIIWSYIDVRTFEGVNNQLCFVYN